MVKPKADFGDELDQYERHGHVLCDQILFYKAVADVV